MGWSSCHPGPRRAGATAEWLLVPSEPVATRLRHPSAAHLLTAQQWEHGKKNPFPLKKSRNILIEPILPLAFQQGEENLGIKVGSSCSLFSPSAPPHSISKGWRRCCRALREGDKALGAGAGPFGSQTAGTYTWGITFAPQLCTSHASPIPFSQRRDSSQQPDVDGVAGEEPGWTQLPPTPPGMCQDKRKALPVSPHTPGRGPGLLVQALEGGEEEKREPEPQTTRCWFMGRVCIDHRK